VPRPPPPDPPGRDPQWADAGSGGYTRLECGCPHAHTPNIQKIGFLLLLVLFMVNRAPKNPPRRINTMLTKITCSRHVQQKGVAHGMNILFHGIPYRQTPMVRHPFSEHRVIHLIYFGRLPSKFPEVFLNSLCDDGVQFTILTLHGL
jgi:hypothetical protein